MTVSGQLAMIPQPTNPVNGTSSENASFKGPFAAMSVLFFMWGFMTVWNDILIPRFKEAFALTYFQAMLVQFAFFGAYGIGALIYYVVSVTSGDPINRIGYKNGVVVGLSIAAFGSALFLPAAHWSSYPFFLIALFIVGLGFAMLQIAANPYIAILGPERTASSRLNLSQAFNSLGTTIGPAIGGWLILSLSTRGSAHGADSVKMPYLGLSVIFAVLALLFKFAHLPNFSNTDRIERGAGALKHPHAILGMGAIFMYVGGEVTVGSLIINFLGTQSLGGLSHEAASRFLSFYWGGLMIGRFMGAFALSDLRSTLKLAGIVGAPVVAFLLIGAGVDWTTAAHYGVLLLVLLVAFLIGGRSPQRMTSTFGVIIILMLMTGMFTSGEIAKWAVIGIGLFCSVMWSNIFSLAIEGLGSLKGQASSLLVMAILGGAFLPPVQGFLADRFTLQASFVVPVVAFAYVAYYGFFGYRVGRARKSASNSR
jgi:MFS transporter, FHS family, L-fucose permease